MDTDTRVGGIRPRWQMLAHNGVLKAKWEGICLKIMPVTEQV